MLQLVTRYLLQNRKVSIPEVGSFTIRTKLPEPDLENRIMGAPVFITEFSDNDQVAEHQIFYLADATQSDADRVKRELTSLGQRLRDRASRDIFEWKGFGSLRFLDNSMVFEPSQIVVEGMGPVRAEKMLAKRPPIDEAVSVLQEKKRRAASPLLLVALIILVLAILFIIWMLYKNNWNLQALGLRVRFFFSPLRLLGINVLV